MAITEKLIVQEAAAAGGDANPNIMLDLNAGDVDSYDGDGNVWYDTHDFEFKPTTNVSEHFNTVLWSGDGSSSKSITDVGFEPDLIWVKARQAQNHTLYDSVRGTGKYLASDTASSEDSSTTYGQLTSFDDDGFTGSKGSDANFSFFNSSSQTYVAWCFNAGGVQETNEEGTIDSTVRANNDLGFSIVKYTGAASATVGHGLDVAPELIITKNLGNSSAVWATYSKALGKDKLIELNSTSAAQSVSNYWGTSLPTSNVFGLSTNSAHYNANGSQIAYCFTSKRGVSKVGSFEGTGASGNKIYTGFEPAFVMWKNADNSASNSMWFMFDNQRGESAYLMANSNSIEGTDASVQFHRDGFTVPNAGAINNSGQTHIYYAVAKNTNETSLIPDTDLELHLDASTYTSGSTWTDSSGNGNNGTITGATHNDELGDFFELDGSGDYIDAPTSGVFTGDFTVEMWWNFNTLNPPSGSAYRMLLGASGYSGGSGLGHYIENQRLRTWISVNGSVSNVLNGSGTDLTTNKWQHIVLTRSGGTYTQYIDTNQVGQATGTTSSLDSSNSRIGAHYNTTSHNIDAKVGQVRLYNTALSQAQIRQNFNFTKPKYPNEFHGDINGATWNSSGYFDFDGSNDFVDLSTSIGSTFWANNWSASAWVYFDSTSPANQCIFTSHGLAYNYLYTNNNTQLRYSNDNGVSIATSSGTISASQWHHIVVTRSSVDGTVIYVDKVSVGTDSSSNNAGASNASGAKPQIGAYTSTGSYPNQYPLDGRVSKFKLYNKALTQSEVDALYNEGE